MMTAKCYQASALLVLRRRGGGIGVARLSPRSRAHCTTVIGSAVLSRTGKSCLMLDTLSDGLPLVPNQAARHD